MIVRALTAACLLALGGCDGIFTTATTSDGKVVVVNRFTGHVERVGEEAAAPSAQVRRPSLTDITLPAPPIRISGAAKYMDGKMLVRMSVRPPPHLVKDDAQWKHWRAYMHQARTLAPTLTLHFTDLEGFKVANHEVGFISMARLVDDKDQSSGFDYQFDIPLVFEAFREISNWEVLWGGWPTWKSLATDASPTTKDAT